MFELKTVVPKLERSKLDRPKLEPSQLDQRAARLRFGRPPEPKQRRTMVMALTLLLVALGFALYHDRDFWFPETQSAQEQEQDQDQEQKQKRDQPQSTTPASTTSAQAAAASPIVSANKKLHAAKPQAIANSPADPAPPFAVIANRTVLPPLEVEVVAGNIHRRLHPGANSVHVDLQPDLQSDLQPHLQPEAQSEGAAPKASQPVVPSAPPDTAASVVSNAADRVQMSADTDEVVSSPVKPGYPLLARQMKVQGSVILQALIGRDGLIQDLRVITGPPILARAAQEAVRQWHFKPHYQGNDAVETQARITVNFTISTN